MELLNGSDRYIVKNIIQWFCDQEEVINNVTKGATTDVTASNTKMSLDLNTPPTQEELEEEIRIAEEWKREDDSVEALCMLQNMVVKVTVRDMDKARQQSSLTWDLNVDYDEDLSEFITEVPTEKSETRQSTRVYNRSTNGQHGKHHHNNKNQSNKKRKSVESKPKGSVTKRSTRNSCKSMDYYTFLGLDVEKPTGFFEETWKLELQ